MPKAHFYHSHVYLFFVLRCPFRFYRFHFQPYLYFISCLIVRKSCMYFLLVVCWTFSSFSCYCIFNNVRFDFYFMSIVGWLLPISLCCFYLFFYLHGYMNNSFVDRVGFFLNPCLYFLRLFYQQKSVLSSNNPDIFLYTTFFFFPLKQHSKMASDESENEGKQRRKRERKKKIFSFVG